MKWLISTIAALLCSTAVHAAIDLKAGEWEFTVRYTISGMPSNTTPQKFRQCLSADDPIPTVFLQARSCSIIEQDVQYRTLRYKLNCFTQDGTLINEGKVRYNGARASGTSKSDLGSVAGRNSVLRYKFEGRFLGSCR